MVSTAKVTSELDVLGNDSGEGALVAGDAGPVEGSEPAEDNEFIVQGLNQAQIQVLAQKIYDLLLDELRVEQERYGRGGLR